MTSLSDLCTVYSLYRLMVRVSEKEVARGDLRGARDRSVIAAFNSGRRGTKTTPSKDETYLFICLHP